MFSEPLERRAKDLIKACKDAGLLLATAESCTGGLLAALLTEIPGSSEVFERGFVTYSNAAKIQSLGVSPKLLESFGAVSSETAQAMVVGALAHSLATMAVSVTGIAGPAGGSATKPVGLVYFALARREGHIISVEKRFGDIGRDAVRLASVSAALKLLEAAVQRSGATS
ncbi:MAG TPA: CinA family protein [Methylocella sp.]|nr:CinA family protein [Methylocella sp.]